MKSLNLESTHRVYLASKGALCIDSDGSETLVGLEQLEAIIYLSMEQRASRGYFSSDLVELVNFLELLNRHQAALPSSYWEHVSLTGYVE
jgi:hypothetical protein